MSPNPHDTFIKTVLKDQAEAINLFEAILNPELQKQLNFTTLSLSDNSLISEDQKEFYSDLLFQCKTKASSNTNLYILFEHKSKADPKTLIQMSNYMNAIHSRQNLKKGLDPILGFVFLQGRGKIPESYSELYSQSELTKNLLQAGIPTNFQVQVFQLQRTDLRKLKLKVTTRILLILMKSIWDRNFLKTFRNILPLIREIPSGKRLEFFRKCIYYIFRARRNDDRNQYYQLLTEEGMPKLKQQALTIAEQLEKEGMEKGIQEGMLKGIKAGKLEDARRMKEEGSTLEFIIKVTGLSQEELKEAGVLD